MTSEGTYAASRVRFRSLWFAVPRGALVLRLSKDDFASPRTDRPSTTPISALRGAAGDSPLVLRFSKDDFGGERMAARPGMEMKDRPHADGTTGVEDAFGSTA